MSRHTALNIYPADALLGGTFTLVAGSSADVTIDLEDFDNLQIIADITYPSGTGSTTGVKLDMYGGIGAKDAAFNLQQVPSMFGISASAVFADNPESVTMVGFTPNAAVSQSRQTLFYLNDPNRTWPRFIDMRFFNQDTSHNCTISLIGDG